MLKNDPIIKYCPLWGEWKVEDIIGTGSFGTVYKIEKDVFEDKYISAVKMISIPTREQYKDVMVTTDDENTATTYFKDMMRNIVNEIKLLYALRGNSNVVSYEDHMVIEKKDEFGWDILIRMEYLTSLTKLLSSKRLTREEIINLGRDMCSAIDFCNKKGIMHRDIKDDNIFVTEDGTFKIGDFGIAKELSKSGRAASMRGTPLYMAPEVYKGQKYDVRADIYSLGIVLYKLLNNGRFPLMPDYPNPLRFNDSEEALEKRYNGEKFKYPVNANKDLGEVILKACAFDPEDRYSSADEMKMDLTEVLKRMADEDKNELVTILKSKLTKFETLDKKQEPQEDDENKTVSIFSNNNIDQTQYLSEAKPKEEEKETSEEPRKSNKKKFIIGGGVAAGIVLCAAIGVFIFFQFSKNGTQASNKVAAAPKKVAAVKKKPAAPKKSGANVSASAVADTAKQIANADPQETTSPEATKPSSPTIIYEQAPSSSSGGSAQTSPSRPSSPTNNAPDPKDQVIAKISNAKFGSLITVSLAVYGKADYSGAAKYKVLDTSNKPISNPAALGSQTSVYPAKAAGQEVRVEILNSSGSVITTVTVTLS